MPLLHKELGMDENDTAQKIGLVYLSESLEKNRLARAFKELNSLTGRVVTTAESCTGGLISAAITEIPGSSKWFDRGFVTYSNQSKMDLLGVKAETLDSHGAVSLQTAREMALGALQRSKANVSISVTGIAGPTGGTEEKPVGTVCIGFMRDDLEKPQAKVYHFEGDRYSVRYQTMMTCLDLLLNLCASEPLEGFE